MAKDSSPKVEDWGLSLADATPRRRKSDGKISPEREEIEKKPKSAKKHFNSTSTCTPSTSLTSSTSKAGVSYGAVSGTSCRSVIANQNDFITASNKRPERVIKEPVLESEKSISSIADIKMKDDNGEYKIETTESGESVMASGTSHILANLVVAAIIVGGFIVIARLFVESTMTRRERKVMYAFFGAYILFILLNNLYYLGGATSVKFTKDKVIITRPYFFGLMSSSAELPRSDFLYATRGQGPSVIYGSLVTSTFTCIGCGVIVSWVLSWLMCAPKDTFHQNYTFPELFFSQTHQMQVKAKEHADIMRTGRDEQGESGLIIVQLRNIPHIADVSTVECERMCQAINMNYGDLPNSDGTKVSSV